MQWRTAWYIAGADGAVSNFLSLWDDFMVWRTKAMAKDVQTHIFLHTNVEEVDQSKIEEMNYEHYHLHARAITPLVVWCEHHGKSERSDDETTRRKDVA